MLAYLLYVVVARATCIDQVANVTYRDAGESVAVSVAVTSFVAVTSSVV